MFRGVIWIWAFSFLNLINLSPKCIRFLQLHHSLMQICCLKYKIPQMINHFRSDFNYSSWVNCYYRKNDLSDLVTQRKALNWFWTWNKIETKGSAKWFQDVKEKVDQKLPAWWTRNGSYAAVCFNALRLRCSPVHPLRSRWFSSTYRNISFLVIC